MMRRSAYSSLLLCGVLMLASCGPRLTQAPPDTDSAKLDWVFTSEGNAGQFMTARFYSGLLDVYDLRVTLTGDNLRVNAAAFCEPEHKWIRCTVPKLLAGQNFRLPVSGSNVDAVALYKRSSSGPDLVRRIGAN